MRPDNSERSNIRAEIRKAYLADEYPIVHQLIESASLTQETREAISARAAELVRQVRKNSTPTLMEKFLAEYGLSTREGVALMCLAEALLRVPDSITLDELIEDKVRSGQWSDHRGRSKSSLINTTTWGLMVAGKLISPSDKQSLMETLRALVKRLGDPMVRTIAHQAMTEMGRQFVLGRNIKEAMKRASKMESRGYTYSYDMLGEAARTEQDAQRYHSDYAGAIEALSRNCTRSDIRDNPGISVKLSALHPRYEYSQRARVLDELVPRTLDLALQAKRANMGFNIDAEEADRLDLSLDVIEAVLSDPRLNGWDGFGVVVQAFGKRAAPVLDWLYRLAERLDRRIMVRLVKGAYWDAEIKRAQVLGLDGFPVFTRKASSDVSYLSCAKKLLGMTDRIYPQFATHNAHSVASVLELAEGRDCFEFQRLHGMGESLHQQVMDSGTYRCRIYAPVGAHQDLLAYLVRRLLENGANSSFVNQIVDTRITPEMIARDPISQIESLGANIASQMIRTPDKIFGERRNARGWDITDPIQLAEIETERSRFQDVQWCAAPIIASPVDMSAFKSSELPSIEPVVVRNPARSEDSVGQVREATEAEIEAAIEAAHQGFYAWSNRSVEERASLVARVADLYETHAAELFALASREAGKTLLDGVAEVREAVDFARYYADQARALGDEGAARGPITCISPWNFPLAIFTGQILAAVAAGNTVLAKPAEQTALMAARAVNLMHEAGLPREVVQLLPGSGARVGQALTSDPRIAGVCFTGSTLTAQRINRVMSQSLAPDAPLIAETGGLNAMIVDSTALPEQVVRDVLASSFQSAGQRCSALRILYLQRDIAEGVLEMLFGAMDQLSLGDPWLLTTDVGPVIDETARTKITEHCARAKKNGTLLKELSIPDQGWFVAPSVIRVSGIEALEEEIFGPVLHVATFEADQIDQVVDQINAKGYGLTFGLHTRIESRVNRIVARIKVGNTYVNRNQIGAIVGSQPFGGEGLSGTGPKAGGPQYLRRFRHLHPLPVSDRAESPAQKESKDESSSQAEVLSFETIFQGLRQLSQISALNQTQRTEKLAEVFTHLPPALDSEAELLPGPTGELNRLACHPRGVILCAAHDQVSAEALAKMALAQGNRVLMLAPKKSLRLSACARLGLPLITLEGTLEPSLLTDLEGFDALACTSNSDQLTEMRVALAGRSGVLIPLITEIHLPERFVIERHLCIDTTAAGGNASLIAASE